MSSPINYKKIIQASVVVAATGLYLKQGSKVTAVALTLLGGVVFAAKVMHIAYGDFFKWRPYRIGAFQSFDPTKHQAALNRALDQIQLEHPKQYQLYLDREKLTDRAQITEHFTKQLKEGCCSGTANAIFERIHRQKCHSLRDGSSQLKEENVFYFQLLRNIGIPKKKKYPNDVETGMRIYERGRQLITESDGSLIHIGQLFCEVMEKMVAELNEERIARKEIFKNVHFEHFLKSAPFFSTSSLEEYRGALKKVTDRFLEERDFVGVLYLPEHVVSFQYGPKGYFIYDSFSQCKGLFAYPDKETFIKELRNHAIYDITHIKQNCLKEKAPRIPEKQREEMADALLKTLQISLRMRPLNKICSTQ